MIYVLANSHHTVADGLMKSQAGTDTITIADPCGYGYCCLIAWHVDTDTGAIIFTNEVTGTGTIVCLHEDTDTNTVTQMSSHTDSRVAAGLSVHDTTWPV